MPPEIVMYNAGAMHEMWRGREPFCVMRYFNDAKYLEEDTKLKAEH